MEKVKEMRVLRPDMYDRLLKAHDYLANSQAAKYLQTIENTLPTLMYSKNLSEREKSDRFKKITDKLVGLIEAQYKIKGNSEPEKETTREVDPDFEDVSDAKKSMNEKLESFFETIQPASRRHKAEALAKTIASIPGVSVDHTNLMISVDGKKLACNLPDVVHEMISPNLKRADFPASMKPVLEKFSSQAGMSQKIIQNASMRTYINKMKDQLSKPDEPTEKEMNKPLWLSVKRKHKRV